MSRKHHEEDAKQFASMFAALGHEARVEILRALLAAHPVGLVVGEIKSEVQIPPSTLSHHLDALRQEGLITQEREGRFLRYRAGTDALRRLLGFLYAECCTRQTVLAPQSVTSPGLPIGVDEGTCGPGCG